MVVCESILEIIEVILDSMLEQGETPTERFVMRDLSM